MFSRAFSTPAFSSHGAPLRIVSNTVFIVAKLTPRFFLQAGNRSVAARPGRDTPGLHSKSGTAVPDRSNPRALLALTDAAAFLLALAVRPRIMRTP